jgi:GAF domain-containing protein
MYFQTDHHSCAIWRRFTSTRVLSSGAMDNTDATSASILAATPIGATDDASDIATAAAREGLDPAQLGAMLIALGGSISDEDDLVVLLQRIVEVAADAIDGADSAGVTIELGGSIYTAVHTDDRTLEVDARQYAAGDGPCLHAARSGEIVLVDVDHCEQRWPGFAADAAREGIHSFLAAPLRTADITLGALNLYGRAPAAFDALDADVLDVLTTATARAIGDYARFKSASEVSIALREAIEHRAPIEQAKGMLMALHRIDADAAFALMRSQSQTSHRKLRDIAHDIIDTLTTTAPG